MKGFIECDSPNEFLELFDGLIHLDNQDNNNIPFPLRFLPFFLISLTYLYS